MTALETVARYYEAWQQRSGDMSDVPLADLHVHRTGRELRQRRGLPGDGP